MFNQPTTFVVPMPVLFAVHEVRQKIPHPRDEKSQTMIRVTASFENGESLYCSGVVPAPCEEEHLRARLWTRLYHEIARRQREAYDARDLKAPEEV